ncbi:MAG: putative toxin-antitoxin system toxin component, PIN family [Gammaproteobacteria bacterium]
MLDTNVLVSAFLWRGAPKKLLERASEGEVQLYTSHELLDELGEVLKRRKFARVVSVTGLTATELLGFYRKLAYRVTARQLARQVSRDRDDDAVLSCALAAKADLIVSGDADLLTLGEYRGIRIASPAAALKMMR